MRTPLRSCLARLHTSSHASVKAPFFAHNVAALSTHLGRRALANVRDAGRLSDEVYFNGTVPRGSSYDSPQPSGDNRLPPDERTVKLGKTVRILHERLPSLLEKPLPQEVLSPQISLHLFPSTHPHLPTVTGRIAYTGALWTAPVAWGRFPVVGNVKIIITSERMSRNSGTSVSHECRDEKLIVKWKTCSGKSSEGQRMYRGVGAVEQLDKLSKIARGEAKDNDEFCGLFIFEFDKDGRIAKHTIEHAEEGGNFDRTTSLVSVTDWLLGRAPWRRRHEEIPGLAWCEDQQRHIREHTPFARSDHER